MDCPGHASLIRTILCGARIIDMVLLVVDITKGAVAHHPFSVPFSSADAGPASAYALHSHSKRWAGPQLLRAAQTPYDVGVVSLL